MLFVSALAAMVLAGSCQQELHPVTDGDTTVKFTVSAGDIATKAIADGTNIDALHWEIYKTAEIATAAQPLGEKTIIDTDQNKEFNVELKLLADQDYTIIFWAEVNGAGHYNTADLRNVQINDYANEMANDESRAAFFKVYPFSTENGVAINETIELTRPFAQINLGSTTYETSFNNVNGGNVKVETTEMTVTNIATSFNTLTGKGEGEQEVTFAAAVTPNAPKDATDKLLLVNDLYYYWLGMNYLIVCGDSDNVEVDVTLVTNFGDVNHTVTNVPVKENYRTNLLGDFLTTGATFNVVVDEEFQTPDEVIVNNGWSNVNGFNYVVNGEAPEDALASILAHADAAAKAATKAADELVVTIDLSGDVFWATGAGIGSTPLLPEDSPISAVVINGNGNTFTATGAGVGEIRLANGGKLTLNNLTIVDKSVSYAENSWEYGYLEMAGVLELNNCEVVNAIMIEGEEATFNVCSFNSNHDNEYAVWVSNGKAYFNGCSFTGARGLKTHEAYGSEVVEIVVDGCWFGPLSEKPGVAIGTMNAETSITIQNSKFSGCQAGDQNLYIYETDTDVTTFAFTQENNEVFGTQSEMLKSTLDNAATGATVQVPAGEYTFPASSIKEGMTLKCAEGTVFQGASSLNIKGATVEGATFSNAAGTVVTSTINGTFKDCVFEGGNALRYCYAGETVVFENCVFSGNTYGIHFDGGANEIIFRNCTFSGFNATAAAVTMTTFEGCTFKSNGKSNYNGINIWGSAKMVNTNFEFDGSVDNEWIDPISADKTYEFTGCTINGGTIFSSFYFSPRDVNTDITIDGTLYEDYANVTYLASPKDMTWFADKVNIEKNSYNGKTVKVTADIDLANVAWTPVGQTGATTFNGVFDGQNYTISNLNVDSDAQTGAHYSSGLFGWVESHTAGHGHIKNVKIAGATIKGHHNCGALVGYITQETALVENCHVTGAAVTCTKANNDADGDKAGALIGNATVATPVKNCTAANSTVSAGRDAGQVIGAGREANVTGCSATNVSVEANGTGTGNNVRNEVIGRLL